MQEQNTNYNPPVYPTGKPKKTIPTFIGVAIIVVVAVLLFGGIFAWQYYFVKPIPQVFQPVGQVNSTAGWETYTNAQYGFEFKYPSKVALENTEKGFSLTHSVPFYHADPCNLKDGGYINKITDFEVVGTVENGDVNEVLRAAKYYGVDFDSSGKPILKDNYNPKEFKIGNLTGYLVTMGAEGCGVDVYYLSLKNNTTLILRNSWVGEFSAGSGDLGQFDNLDGIILPNKRLEYFNQILSSFKFTTPDQTAGWKTYTNTQYGFEIKYNPNYYANANNSLPGGNAGFYVSISYAEPNAGPVVPSYWYQVTIKQGVSSLSALKNSYAGGTFTNTIIPGQEALDIKYKFLAGAGGDVHSVGIIKNNMAYIVDYFETGNSQKIEHEKEFEQMLSTFKFTK